MNILGMDTSNQVLGVAVMKNGEIAAELITNIKKDHSSRLMPAIVDMMNEDGHSPQELDKIAVAKGPGSYTGTRIGVTTAKTLSWSLEIPLYLVSSLEIIAANAQFYEGYICPFFDARRKTVFTGLYKSEKGHLKNVLDECNVDMSAWLNKLKELEEEIMFLSPHLDSFEDMIVEQLGDDAIMPNNIFHIPRPSALISLSEQKQKASVHLASPNYLRMTEAETNWLKRQKDGRRNG